MLQFITKTTQRFSMAEEAQMAIEGGCRWIQLSAASIGDIGLSLREVANEIIPLCQENEAFLIIEDDVNLVEELKVHGVFLRDHSRTTVMEARERLGAHAVIGVYAASVEDVIALKGLDVDYVAVPVPVGNAPVADIYARFIQEVSEPGFHIVALGEFGLDELPGILEAGCAGVAVSSAIADSDNPVEATSAMIEVLEKARYGG